jgi:hypothetical protein
MIFRRNKPLFLLGFWAFVVRQFKNTTYIFRNNNVKNLLPKNQAKQKHFNKESEPLSLRTPFFFGGPPLF